MQQPFSDIVGHLYVSYLYLKWIIRFQDCIDAIHYPFYIISALKIIVYFLNLECPRSKKF